MFGYTTTQGGALAYPTDPSQVGLTVAKNTLSVVTSNTTYNTNQTISNTFFQRQVRVTNSATVTFTNCWFVPNQTTYGFGDVALRIDSGSTVTVTNCEFGITAAEAQTYLSGDGSWIEAYGTQIAIECPAAYSSGTVTIDSCHFHHCVDYVRPQGGWTITNCYMADIAIHLDLGLHADCIQFNRGILDGTQALVENSFIRANLHPDTLFDSETTYANRAVFVKPDEADIDGTITVDGCYLDSEGFYPASTTSDEIFGYGVSAVVHWSNNVIGRSATEDAITDQQPGVWVSTFENNTLESPMSATYETKETTTAGGGSPLVFTIPATSETGDVLVIGAKTSTNSAGSWTKPSAAVELQTEVSTTGSAFLLTVWSYVVDASDTPGTTTLSFQYSVATNQRGTMLAYTGNDTSSPVVTSTKAFDTGFNTTFTGPAATTTDTDQIVLVWYASRQNTSVSTPSPAATEREDTTDTNGVLAVYEYVKASAGDTGSHTVTAAAANFNAGITVVLANAPAAPAASSGQSSMTAGGALRDDLATILY